MKALAGKELPRSRKRAAARHGAPCRDGGTVSFAVDHNDLEGPIPDPAGLDNLVEFDVNSNRLDGPLPAALSNLFRCSS